MAEGEESNKSGRRDMLKRLIVVLQNRRGDKTPMTGDEVAGMLLPVVGALGSYADDFHGAKHEVEGFGERFAKMDKQDRRKRNSAQFLKELNDSKDKEAVEKAYHAIVQKIYSRLGDSDETREKIASMMDDLVDEANKSGQSALESICNAAKAAGLTNEESRQVAAKAVEETPSEDENPATKEAVKDEEEDKPLTREEFEKSSDEEAGKAADEPEAEPQEEEPAEEEDAGNPDATSVIERAKNPHDGGEGSRKGEPDADELSRLANSRDPKDRAKYKRALGY